MRILHVVHDYLPDQVAGVEVYTNRVAGRQSENHDVGILFARIDPRRATGEVERSVDGKLRLFALTQNRSWSRFEQTWNDSCVMSGVDAVLDDFAPEVVHVQHLMNLGLAWLEGLERRRIPSVMTLHDQWLACAAGGQRFRADRRRCDDLDAARCATCTATSVGPALALRGHLQRRAADGKGASLAFEPSAGRRLGTRCLRSSWSALVGLRGASRIENRWAAMRQLGERIDAFIAPSDEILEAALEFGLPADRLVRLQHGFSQPPIGPRLLPDRLLRFGYFGSLVPHKGVHHLIEAFSALPAAASLDVYGSLDDAPEYVAELRERVGHPGIRLHGVRSPEDVAPLMAGLDCVVAPSIWRENAPLTVQEAFVSGRPVVASNLGGHRELLARGGGLLFEPGDVDSLRVTLLRLVHEPELGRELAASIPEIQSLDDHVDRLVEIYRRALDRVVMHAPLGFPPSRVVFLDRDGVINYDSAAHVRSVDDWEPIVGSLEAIARLSRAGYRVVVVTNQSGLARALYEEADLEEIHACLEAALVALGGHVEAVFFCPHAPDAGCDCRKPRTGLIDRARRELGVDPLGALFVGDRVSDLMAARGAGCCPIFVRSGRGVEAELGEEWEDVLRFDDLAAVVEALLSPAGWPPLQSASQPDPSSEEASSSSAAEPKERF